MAGQDLANSTELYWTSVEFSSQQTGFVVSKVEKNPGAFAFDDSRERRERLLDSCGRKFNFVIFREKEFSFFWYCKFWREEKCFWDETSFFQEFISTFKTRRFRNRLPTFSIYRRNREVSKWNVSRRKDVSRSARFCLFSLGSERGLNEPLKKVSDRSRNRSMVFFFAMSADHCQASSLLNPKVVSRCVFYTKINKIILLQAQIFTTCSDSSYYQLFQRFLMFLNWVSDSKSRERFQ